MSPVKHGRQVFGQAVPGRVDLVRNLVFDALPDHLLDPLAEVLDHIHDNLAVM